MILIDTNVISEPIQPLPNGRVTAWIDAQAVETLYLSSITVAEMRFGIATLPEGRRKERLRERFEQEILPIFDQRILSFDLRTSEAYANLMAKARSHGKPIGKADGYIAATAALHGFSIATRDTAPFDAAGLTVIDPWNDPLSAA